MREGKAEGILRTTATVEPVTLNEVKHLVLWTGGEFFHE